MHLNPVRINAGIIICWIICSERVGHVDIDTTDGVDEFAESLEINGQPVFNIQTSHQGDLGRCRITTIRRFSVIIGAILVRRVDLVILA